jgi:O-antigen/teichoic acid export membrane protein
MVIYVYFAQLIDEKANMSDKGRLVNNSAAIITHRLAQVITSFFLTIIIVRYLGTFGQGQYALGYTYYLMLSASFSQGFKILFTREISQNIEDTHLYLISGSLLQLIFSLIGYIGLFLLVSLLPYQIDTKLVCYVIGLAVLPFSLSNISEAIFQAHEKMHLITYSTVPIYVLRVLFMWFALSNGATINIIAWLVVISETIIMFLQWILIRRIVSYVPLAINLHFLKKTLKQVRTFLFIQTAATIRLRLQLIILSVLAGEVATGIFSIIMQLIRPFNVIVDSIVLPLFPRMSQMAINDRLALKNLSEQAISVLFFFVLPLVIGFLFIGEDFLLLIYKDENLIGAGLILTLVGIGLFGTTFTRPLGLSVISAGFERVDLRVQIVSIILGIILSPILIANFQLIGAAVASTTIELLAGLQILSAVYSNLFKLNFLKILKKPLFVAISVFVTFGFLNLLNVHTIVTIGIVGIVYLLILATVILEVVDEDNMLKQRFKGLLSNLIRW